MTTPEAKRRDSINVYAVTTTNGKRKTTIIGRGFRNGPDKRSGLTVRLNILPKPGDELLVLAEDGQSFDNLEPTLRVAGVTRNLTRGDHNVPQWDTLGEAVRTPTGRGYVVNADAFPVLNAGRGIVISLLERKPGDPNEHNSDDLIGTDSDTLRAYDPLSDHSAPIDF